jgi:hypothetical protein
MKLFVLVRSEVKANAARDLSPAVGFGVLVDVLHLRISPAPRLNLPFPACEVHHRWASAETFPQALDSVSKQYLGV